MKDFFGKEIVIGDKVLFSNRNNERILIGNVTEIGITRARINANCKKTFAFLDEYVPPPTRKERRKRERELKKKFPLDLTKFIESHRT